MIFWTSLAWAAPPFDDCERGVIEAPADRRAWRCFYQEARRSGAWEEAGQRLDAHLGVPGTSLWAGLSRAHVADAAGDPSSGERYTKLMAEFDASGDVAGRVMVRLALKNLPLRNGDEARAQALITEALEIAKGDETLTAYAEGDQARLDWRTGRFEEALALLETIAPVIPRVPEADRQQLALLYHHVLAGVTLEVGQVDRSWAAGEELQRLAVADGDRYVESSALINNLFLLLDHPELRYAPDDPGFVAYVADLDAAAKASNHPWAQAWVPCLRGMTEAPERAAASFRECKLLCEEIGDVACLYTAHRGEALALPRSEEAAAEALLAAIPADGEEQDTIDLSELAMVRGERAWRRGDFEGAERSWSAAVQGLMATRDAQETEAPKLRVVSRNAVFWQLAASRWAHKDDEPSSWERALRWSEGLRNHHHPGAVIPTIAELQGLLGEGEVVWAPQVPVGALSGTRERPPAWALTISRGEVKRRSLGPGRELARRAALFRDTVASEADGGGSAGSGLFVELMEDVARGPLPKRLVVVADGALGELPFGALRTPDGRPLGEQVAIDVVPSLASWAAGRRSGAQPKGPLGWSAVVDPAPGERARALQSGLPALPGSASEVAALKRAFGEGRVLSGGQATVAGLSGGGRLVHVSAHARPDRTDPQKTFLILAPSGPGDDGLINPAELGALVGLPDVVVLAGCGTAVGEVVDGEGALSLARGLFQGGARVVVATRWPISDLDAAGFAGPFYQALSEGAAVDEAAKAATAALRASGRPAEGWAGWVVLGEGSLVPFPEAPGRRGPWGLAVALGIAAVAGLAGLIGLVVRRRSG